MQQNKPYGKHALSWAAIAVSQLISMSAFAAQSDAERIAELEKKLGNFSKNSGKSVQKLQIYGTIGG